MCFRIAMYGRVVPTGALTSPDRKLDQQILPARIEGGAFASGFSGSRVIPTFSAAESGGRFQSIEDAKAKTL